MNHLNQLEVFAKVVELNSFSAAARVLGITKSTVSKYIAELEAHLGTRLLHRSTRRIAVTEAGNLLFARCAGLLQCAAEALQAAAAPVGIPKGTLRVTAPGAFGRCFAPSLLAEFLKLYPGIEVELQSSERGVSLLGAHADVAFHIGALPDSLLLARKLGQSRRRLCAAPAYLAAHGVPLQPMDLPAHQCLVYINEAGTSMDTWRVHGARGTELIKLRGRVRATSGDILLELALAGVGIGYPVGFAAAPHLQAGRLVPVLPQWTGEEVPIYLLYPPGIQQEAKVRAFVDFAVERLGRDELWAG